MNYPLKAALHELCDADLIDISEASTKFCVSAVARNVAEVGVQRFVRAWNEHTIPHHGVPSAIFREQCLTSRLPAGAVLPTGMEASYDYMQNGGHLTQPGDFGQDPLWRYPHLANVRLASFQREFPDPSDLFSTCVNGHATPFKSAVLKFIELTENLTP